MKFKFQGIKVLFNNTNRSSWLEIIDTNEKKDNDMLILKEISWDKSVMTKQFIKDNKDCFKDENEKKLVLDRVDKFTKEIVRELNNKFPELKNVKDKSMLYDMIKYNVLQNNLRVIKALYKNENDWKKQLLVTEKKLYTTNNIINICKINKDDFRTNDLSNLMADLYNNRIVTDQDVNNYDTFKESNKENSDNYIFLKKLHKLAPDSTIIDYKAWISPKYANILKYIDWYNSPFVYITSKNSDFIKKGQKFTPDEIVALTIVFSWQEERLKDIERGNISIFLKNLWNKFNISSNWDINNVYEFKKAFVAKFAPIDSIVYIKNDKKKYEAFLDMVKYAKFIDIYNILFLDFWIKKDTWQFVPSFKDEKDSYKNSLSMVNSFFYNSISTYKDNSEFVKNYNIVFWFLKHKGRKEFDLIKDEKEIKKVKEQKDLNSLFILEWIRDKLDVDSFVNNLKILEKENIYENSKMVSIKEKIATVLKDRSGLIESFKNYSKDGNSNIFDFFRIYLADKWFKNFFNTYNTKTGERGFNKKKYKVFIGKFINFIQWNVKKDIIKKEYKLSNSNKDFNEFINNSITITDTSNLLLKLPKNNNSQETKLSKFGGLSWNLFHIFQQRFKIELIHLLIKNNKNVLDRTFLQDNQSQLFKDIQSNLAIIWIKMDKTKANNLFKTFLWKIPPKWFTFNKKQIEFLISIENSKYNEELEKFNKLWYRAYLWEKEKEKNERDLLNKTWWICTEEIPVENSVFAWKHIWDFATHFEEKGWVYVIQVKFPWQERVLKITSLECVKANKLLINAYLSNMFDLPLEIKWNTDSFNKIVTNETDIWKKWMTVKDFYSLDLFLQTYFYEYFFKDPKGKKGLIKKYQLNPYDMYTKPKLFAKQFANMLRETNSTYISGMKFNGKYVIDLQKVNSKIFDKNKQRQDKEYVLDKGREYYSNNGGSIMRRVKDFFFPNKWKN